MENDFLVVIRDSPVTTGFGNKGLGLHWLARHNFNIPDTLVLTFEGCRRINGFSDRFDPEVAGGLEQQIDPQKYYAVRSSANLEDGKQFSFAGQFTTKTNVQGIDAVQASIQDVLSSGKSGTLKPYLRNLTETSKDLEMAVLIQEMVDPVLSGVVFSKNPMTGLDEVVIEAVQGLGESLVQGGVTPDRWIYRWGQFVDRPEGREEYDRTIKTIAVEARQIAKRYGESVDLEWAYDGRNLYWLQIRPITVLTQVPLYSNRISREVLPGIIKPLISSINIPLVNTAWIRLFDRLLGPTGLKPEDLTRIFHHRAYFNMGTIGTLFEMLGFPRESLEMLLGLPVKSKRPRVSWRTLRPLPRVLRFAVQAWNYDKRVDAELRGFEEAVREFQRQEFGNLSESELVLSIHHLNDLNTRIAYQNIVIPLLMNLYNALLKFQLQRAGIDIVNVDYTAGLDEMGKYDPNIHLDGLKRVFEQYSQELQENLRRLDYEQLRKDPRFTDYFAELECFIELFGHLSDNGSDFSRKAWREDPEVVVRLAINHAVNVRGQHKKTWESLPISGFVRWWLTPIYTRARRFRLRREQVSSIYSSSYGWFRVLFGALANRLVARGALQKKSDIYYLTWSEIQVLVEVTGRDADLQALIQSRRQEVEESREIVLPETIYGNVPPPLKKVRIDAPKRKGIPTSPGYYQGLLTVVRSLEDFSKVRSGDVIAIPYSDIAWTPLFSKAGAVVAEAGGMLSHSSIVAREYNIPCVVSVNGATDLPENSVVYVDGYQGEVTLVRQDRIIS